MAASLSGLQQGCCLRKGLQGAGAAVSDVGFGDSQEGFRASSVYS